MRIQALRVEVALRDYRHYCEYVCDHGDCMLREQGRSWQLYHQTGLPGPPKNPWVYPPDIGKEKGPLGLLQSYSEGLIEMPRKN